MSDKSYLVTGGAGFIGCVISSRLAPGARRYVVVDSLHPQVHIRRERPANLHLNAELIVADVREESTWDEIFAKWHPDVIIHLAAETGTGQSLTEASRHASVNVVGTTQLLDSLSKYSVLPERLLLTSSRAVYGEGRWERSDGTIRYPGQRSHAQLKRCEWDFPGMMPLASSFESTAPAPTSIYGATKLAQEHILAAWCLARGVPLSILRLQNVYGPGQSLTNSYTGIVVLFAQLARQIDAIPLYEDGLVTRDFVYIEDVAEAISLAVTGSVGGIHLDIGSGERKTILELAKSLARRYDAPTPVVTGEFRDGDVRHAWCDISSARNVLKWEPRWQLEKGLKSLLEWVETERLAGQ